jgi:hypothetical protein
MKNLLLAFVLIFTMGGCSGIGQQSDQQPVFQVIKVAPRHNSRNVPIDTNFTIIFNANCKPATITNSSIRLLKGSLPVSGNLEVKADQVVLKLAASLDHYTLYTLVITKNITDPDNNLLPGQYRFVFVTELAPGYVAMPVPNYQNRIVQAGSVVEFTSLTDQSNIEIATNSDINATVPGSSWHTGATFTFTALGEIKLFARTSRGAVYSAVL